MIANNFQSTTSNLFNLQQEFDDVFDSICIPKNSRQISMGSKPKPSSEPLHDSDEDFTAINKLIHRKVSETTTSEPIPSFKNIDALDFSHTPRPSQNPQPN